MLNNESETTGSRDVFGYLRWTPTSCRRCGYEKQDCTCTGGFAAPTSKGDEQTPTTVEQGEPLNGLDRLRALLNMPRSYPQVTCSAAADEIERLRSWLDYINGNHKDARECARIALEGKLSPYQEPDNE